jgi:hypothetical protein
MKDQGQSLMVTNTVKFIAASACILLILALSLTAVPAEAMGKFDLIVMESEGLSFQVFDSEFLDFYAFSNFTEANISALPSMEEGILVTRYSPVDDVYIEPYDQLIYYPSANGSGGYVFYVGLMDGSSDYDQKWYQGNPEAEMMINNTFNSYEKDLSKIVIAALIAFAGLIVLILRGVR